MKEKATGKAHVGPGGMNCSCCTKGTKKFHKRLSNRWLRKKAKKDLQSR